MPYLPRIVGCEANFALCDTSATFVRKSAIFTSCLCRREVKRRLLIRLIDDKHAMTSRGRNELAMKVMYEVLEFGDLEEACFSLTIKQAQPVEAEDVPGRCRNRKSRGVAARSFPIDFRSCR